MNFYSQMIAWFKEAIDSYVVGIEIEEATKILLGMKGRLFILGMGGSYANAIHAVADFNNTTRIRAVGFDNPAMLSAMINDHGDWAFVRFLERNNFSNDDVLMILSVGGGDIEHKVSMQLVNAIVMAEKIGAKTISIVGKRNGYAYTHSTEVIDVGGTPELQKSPYITSIAESAQSLILHMICANPDIKNAKFKWEEIDEMGKEN